jgi:hypothetical protein
MIEIKNQDLLLSLIQIINNCGSKANKLDFYKNIYLVSLYHAKNKTKRLEGNTTFDRHNYI